MDISQSDECLIPSVFIKSIHFISMDIFSPVCFFLKQRDTLDNLYVVSFPSFKVGSTLCLFVTKNNLLFFLIKNPVPKITLGGFPMSHENSQDIWNIALTTYSPIPLIFFLIN